jgi:hypothetical protein
MFINFIIKEPDDPTKILQYEGSYTVKDLETIFTELMDPSTVWFRFASKPNGFVTRKEYIRTVYLRESLTE